MPQNRPDFYDRQNQFGPTYVGTNPRPVPDGATVTLKLEDVLVLVCNVKVHAGTYSGVISGFEPPVGPDFRGYAEGDKVEFTESNIFTVG